MQATSSSLHKRRYVAELYLHHKTVVWQLLFTIYSKYGTFQDFHTISQGFCMYLLRTCIVLCLYSHNLSPNPLQNILGYRGHKNYCKFLHACTPSLWEFRNEYFNEQKVIAKNNLLPPACFLSARPSSLSTDFAMTAADALLEVACLTRETSSEKQ